MFLGFHHISFPRFAIYSGRASNYAVRMTSERGKSPLSSIDQSTSTHADCSLARVCKYRVSDASVVIASANHTTPVQWEGTR